MGEGIKGLMNKVLRLALSVDLLHYSSESFTKLYRALVRPHLSIWYPHLMKDLDAMEKVQIRATRLVELRSRSYSERLQKLDLPTLKLIARRYNQNLLTRSFVGCQHCRNHHQRRFRPRRKHSYHLCEPVPERRSYWGCKPTLSSIEHHRYGTISLARLLRHALLIHSKTDGINWENQPMMYDHRATL